MERMRKALAILALHGIELTDDTTAENLVDRIIDAHESGATVKTGPGSPLGISMSHDKARRATTKDVVGAWDRT
jgi:hypothetical protein